MNIGILALQGGFALHEQKLSQLGFQSKRIIYSRDLDDIQGLIIPGGESSTMLRICNALFFDDLKKFANSHPVWGICAGAILIAGKVENPSQESLGLIDFSAQRNAYGNQNDSFIAEIKFEFLDNSLKECIFIRAPKIASIGPSVQVLATYNKEIVMIEQNLHMASTFHPELTDCTDFHEYFLKKVENAT